MKSRVRDGEKSRGRDRGPDTNTKHEQGFFPSHGFTLVELLVVVGIMGLLVAIAIPQFVRYRKGAFDRVVWVDLRNAAVHEEAIAALEGNYTDSIDALKKQGLTLSPGVVDLKVSVAGQYFSVSARHSSCAPGTGAWTYSNQTGVYDGTSCE